MTPAEIKKTRLYRTLAPCVRKEDRDELAWRLASASDSNSEFSGNRPIDGRISLSNAFIFSRTAEGHAYWWELRDRLQNAGHECW